jgi:hypothetical protein
MSGDIFWLITRRMVLPAFSRNVVGTSYIAHIAPTTKN